MSFEDYRDPSRPRPAPVPVPYVPPPPQPAPQPTTPAVASVNRWNQAVWGIILAFTLLNVGLLAYREFRPNPTPGPAPTPAPIPAPVDPAAVKLGKAYAPVIVSTNADAWDAAAAQLAAGKEMDDAQKAMQETWLAGRTAWFTANLKPAIVAILPEGDKLEPQSRAAMIALFKGIARGERGTK